MERQTTSVKREIIINVSPEKVWKALTVPSERNKWETKSCEMELRNGGEAFFDYGWNSTYRCKIKAIIENEKLVLEGDDHHLTIWTLVKVENGTKVSIEYTGFWVGDLGHSAMDNMVFGTYQFMRNLKCVLENHDDIRSSFWKSWIGVSHTTLHDSDAKGPKIVHVMKGTPAYGNLKVGDIITEVDQQDVTSHDDFEIYVTEKGADSEIELSIIRNNRPIRIQLLTVPFGAIATR